MEGNSHVLSVYQRTHRFTRCFDSKGAKRRGTLDFRTFFARTMPVMSCLLEAHDQNDRKKEAMDAWLCSANWNFFDRTSCRAQTLSYVRRDVQHVVSSHLSAKCGDGCVSAMGRAILHRNIHSGGGSYAQASLHDR